METLTTEQKEVLKEIPGYIRRDVLYEHIENAKYKPSEIQPFEKDDYKRGYNTALAILKFKMDNGVI